LRCAFRTRILNSQAMVATARWRSRHPLADLMTKDNFSPVSAEAIEAFGDRVLRSQRRIASLHLRATDPQLHERQEAFAEASHELLVAMESLQVAEEELRQQQEALRQSHDELHTERDRLLRLFHQAPDGYLITDSDGKIVEANARAGELLGRDINRLQGKPLPLMVDEADRSRFRLLLNQLAKADWREEWIGSFSLAKGQSFRAALTTSVDRDAKGQVQSIRWSLRDISTREAPRLTTA
jgi:PAS domain S-box-containing protein